jgi:plasmid stabilization system protein ParE
VKRCVYRQAALDELTDLIEFIAEDKPGAARGVLEVIEQRVAHFAMFPESAPLVENLVNAQLEGLRRAVMTPYRTYVMYYFIREDSIEVVSVRRAEGGEERLD